MPEHGTVEQHVIDGTIVPRTRTTADDLDWAATWLEAYEGCPDTDKDVLTIAATVAAALRRDSRQRRRQADDRRAEREQRPIRLLPNLPGA